MRLTTKGRFAVTAMIDVALRCGEGPVTLAGISERQKISLSYLEQLFGKLRRRNLVESVRGPGGGYCLARAAGEISVADIIRPTVHGRARRMICDTGVGKADSDGPRSPRARRDQKVRYCSKTLPCSP